MVSKTGSPPGEAIKIVSFRGDNRPRGDFQRKPRVRAGRENYSKAEPSTVGVPEIQRGFREGGREAGGMRKGGVTITSGRGSCTWQWSEVHSCGRLWRKEGEDEKDGGEGHLEEIKVGKAKTYLGASWRGRVIKNFWKARGR